MYGTYGWNSGATAAQVLQDIAELIGGKAIAALSAGCNKAGSVIAGAASGWTCTDPAYGALTAPCADGISTKAVRVLNTGAMVQLAACEVWNAATHAATNQTTAKDAAAWSGAAAGAVNFIATPDVLAIYAADLSKFGWCGEILPGMPQSVAGTPWFVSDDTWATAMPRLKNGNPTAGYSLNYAGNQQSQSIPAMGRNAAEATFWPLLPRLHRTNNSSVLGYVRGIWDTTENTANSGDLLTGSAGEVYLLMRRRAAADHSLEVYTMALERK